MTSKTLRRTTYRNPKTNLARDDATGNRESLLDMEEYFQPLEQISSAGLYEWGIADGLSATAALGSPNLMVTPGVALDSEGRHIALAVGGKAETHSQAMQGAEVVTVSTLVTVTADGVLLDTNGHSGARYVTIQWRESFDEQLYSNSQNQVFQMLHTPWLRLVDVNDFNDAGNELVLAQITIDDTGNVLELNPTLRRQIGVAVGVVQFQRTVDTLEQIERGAAAEIRARGDGGLDISTPLTDANGNMTWQQRLSIDGSTGNVGIGMAEPKAKLTVDDLGADTSWNTAAFHKASLGPNWSHIHWGPTGDWFIRSAAASGHVVIQDTGGNVGIGTIDPQATLHIEGGLLVSGQVRGVDSEIGRLLKIDGALQGGGTATGWVLGGQVGSWRKLSDSSVTHPDNWLRLTTNPERFIGFGRGPSYLPGAWHAEYHDLAVNSFWAAAAQRYDLAEVTPVRPEDALEQGDAVVIDRVTGLRVTRSTQAYDKAVYGIVSSYEQAALVIGSYGGPETVADRQDILPIALVGRVKAKVSAENGPIEIGDILTTADTPGHLMKSNDPQRQAGAIAGKALEPFDAGLGTIFVLVTLQ